MHDRLGRRTSPDRGEGTPREGYRDCNPVQSSKARSSAAKASRNAPDDIRRTWWTTPTYAALQKGCAKRASRRGGERTACDYVERIRKARAVSSTTGCNDYFSRLGCGGGDRTAELLCRAPAGVAWLSERLPATLAVASSASLAKTRRVMSTARLLRQRWPRGSILMKGGLPLGLAVQGVCPLVRAPRHAKGGLLRRFTRRGMSRKEAIIRSLVNWMLTVCPLWKRTR